MSEKPTPRRAGPGRGNKAPDGTTAVTRSISFHPDRLAALDAFAAREGLSRSEALAALIDRALSGDAGPNKSC